LKKIPLRMCVGCREMKEKKQLIRVVRTADHCGELDFTGKKPGRGAYICNNVECLKKAKKSKSLERALNVSLGDDVYDRLLEEMQHGSER
jgi:predicted RNA-binding protein YlxR (DUF448 family)